MKIAIFGLGYVGTVSAACFAALGHDVTGVDVDAAKAAAVANGRSPIVEPGLDDLVAASVASGRLKATTDPATALADAELSFVCVGTPSRENGSLNLDFVERVVADIAAALGKHDGYHVVVIRSTVLPGSIDERVVPALQRGTGRTPGDGYGLAVNPEFLREGSSIADFHEPPKIVIGELDKASGDVVARAYEGIEAPLVRTSIRTAEMVKYADNSFHALKISFANEIGNICKAAGIDGRDVMEIFRLDTKLNISPAYLKPGGAFGGSCLPKDLRALVYHARSHDVRTPMLAAILESNGEQKRLAYEMIRRTGKRRIGLLGLSFKPDTDDLRESPAVELAETLIGKGCDVAIYDRNVALARLVGSNRAYIEREIPHVSSLMQSTAAAVVERSDVIVVTTRDPEFDQVLARASKDQTVIDLVGITASVGAAVRYCGICW